MTGNQKYRRLLYGLPLIATLAWGIFLAVKAPYSDYAAYYFGGKQLLAGNPAFVYDTYQFNLHIAGLGYKGIFVSYTPFTPFTAIVSAPFLGLNIAASKLLFNITSSAIFLFTIYRCYRHFNFPAYTLLCIPLVLWMPLTNNLLFGQAYLILFSLLVEGYIALQQDRLWRVACCWGAAILFKVFPAILLLYLLTRKKYKAAIYVTAACLILLLASIAVTGIQSWLIYASVLPRLSNGELNDSFTFMFQSFFMLSKDVFVYDKLLNPSGYFNSVPGFVISLVIFKTCITTAAIAATTKRNTNELLVFGLWLIASLLLSPNGSSYSLVLSLVPLLGIVNTSIHPAIKLAIAAIVMLACNINVHSFASLPVLLRFPRLYLMLAAFIVLLFCLRLRLTYSVLLPVLLFFGVTESLRLLQTDDHSEYLLDKEEHILITDVFAAGGRLCYNYWSNEGEQTVQTGIPAAITRRLSLANNQVVYNGKPVTQAADWKRRPLLVNNAFIVYLSDKNRGVGFFTLRKIKLEQ